MVLTVLPEGLPETPPGAVAPGGAAVHLVHQVLDCFISEAHAHARDSSTTIKALHAHAHKRALF